VRSIRPEPSIAPTGFGKSAAEHCGHVRSARSRHGGPDRRAARGDLQGLFFTIQKTVPLMKEGGSIVLTTSFHEATR
jgi:hypothetical protein